MSSHPLTSPERARLATESLILAGLRSQVATARRIANPGRRRRALDTIHTRLIGHTWPVAGHVELTEIRDAALRLAEEVRYEVSGPRLAPVDTVRRRGADAQPFITEIGG